MRRMRVRGRRSLSRLRLIRLLLVGLLSMARLAIGRQAARWFRVRRRISIGTATAAAEGEIGIALLESVAAIRLTALFAAHIGPTPHIRSAAIRAAALSLIGRHAAAVSKSEATTNSAHQASSRSGNVEGMRRPTSGCGCHAERQHAASDGASGGPQQCMRTEHGVRESFWSGGQSARMDECRERARLVAAGGGRAGSGGCRP